jgi:hypothetical protein
MHYIALIESIGRATLTDQELRNINELVIEKLKANRSIQAVSIKQSLQVGMTITVDHNSHRDEVFTIKKINRTKIVITDTKGRNMSAPISMVIPM